MIRRRPPRDGARKEPIPAAVGDWAWVAAGGGPDLAFRARVAAGDATRLAQLVAGMPLPGFTVDDITPPQGPDGCTRYDDEATHAALREQYAAGSRSNIYIFNEITVTGSELVVVRGYGGRPDPSLARAETRLLAGLALAPDIALELWAVRQEGYGPGSDRSIVEGATGFELFDYLFYGERPLQTLREDDHW